MKKVYYLLISFYSLLILGIIIHYIFALFDFDWQLVFSNVERLEKFSFFVIVLTPIIMWIFGMLAKAGKTISTPRKIAYGMFIAGLGYLFLALYSASAGYPSGEEFKAMEVGAKEAMKAGPWVLIVTYFFLTVAELFISPLGLSFVSKVAPKHLQGVCQGLWLGATAVGNLLIWIGPLMYNKMPLWQCWTVFLVVCLVSMGVMLGMVKWLERVTGESEAPAKA